jgi:hypothetical protein
MTEPAACLGGPDCRQGFLDSCVEGFSSGTSLSSVQ